MLAEKEKVLARTEELSDCRPFCGNDAHKSGGLAHSVMQALSLVGTKEKEVKVATSQLRLLAKAKEEQEAKAEERTHCEPFCGLGKTGRKDRDSTPISGHLKLAKLLPDSTARRPLTPEDKKKIHEAALKIAGVISESQG
jgi:hypothetical protein